MDLKNPYYLKYAFYGKYLIPKYTQDYCYIDGIMHLTEILCVFFFGGEGGGSFLQVPINLRQI